MSLTLNFLITPTYNTKTIAIKDTSTYPTSGVSNSLLEVTIPGFDPVELVFTPNETLILNSTLLNITSQGEEDLPDGLYTFKYSVNPNSVNFVEKTIFRVEQLQEKFDNAFIKLDLNNSNDTIKKQQKVSLDTINYFIQGAIAAANNCATEEALILYKKANKLLDNFINRGECCGITFPSNFY